MVDIFGELSGIALKELIEAFMAKDNNTMKEEKGLIDMVVSKKTKTALIRLGEKLGIVKYENGVPIERFDVMPAIEDVRTYNDDKGEPCAIYLDFADGTSTSAARRENDIYSLEHGITICIAKKLLDMITNGAGNQTYNKLVRNASKVLSDKNKLAKKVAEKIEEDSKVQAHKLAKLAEKKRRRDEKQNALLREELIEIQKEAIIRAMKEMTANDTEAGRPEVEIIETLSNETSNKQ